MSYSRISNTCYYLPILIDDPSKKRIIVEITENPAGVCSQILFCIDTEVVDVNTTSIAVSDETFFSCSQVRPAGLTRTHSFTSLPTLRMVLKDESKRYERNKYRKDWMRKKRQKEIEPVVCKQCSKSFTPKRSTATFCSSNCRLKAFRTKDRMKA